MKSCNRRGSFYRSILTIYRNVWATFWQVYWCHLYFFLCEVPKYVQIKNRQTHLDWDFSGSGLASLSSWLGMVNAGWLGSIRPKIFLQMNLSFSKVFLFTIFYLGRRLYIISSLFTHFCLSQIIILHKMLKLGLWDFNAIFLRMQFSLVATF